MHGSDHCTLTGYLMVQMAMAIAMKPVGTMLQAQASALNIAASDVQ